MPAPWILGFAGGWLVLLAAALSTTGATSPVAVPAGAAPLEAPWDGSGAYQPHAPWIGRLILPAPQESWPGSGPAPRDWVWLELQQAPPAYRGLVRRRLPLTWQARPEIDRLVRLVTTDVRFTPGARQAAAMGWVLPERLDGRAAVGPLVSLAGARPQDDLQVSLEQVQVERADQGSAVLRLARPPIQISGRYKALVQVLGPDLQGGPDRFLVRHFNRRSRRFDGRRDSVRIPEAPLDASGLRRPFSPAGLIGSPAGRDGWYVFGEPDAAGVFTVRALQPRALVRLQPDRRLAGAEAGWRFLHQQQWQHLQRQQGRLSRTWIQPAPAPAPNSDPALAVARTVPQRGWRLGDEALVLHLFGGMGGPNGELQVLDDLFATGHFAFGLARVVRDSLSDEPIWTLRYYQLYTHNREGIVSGSQDWTAFVGDLQRGWLGLRPISDVLVRFEPLSRPLGPEAGISSSPLWELGLQSEVMMARYRTGDGTGFTGVGLFQSCVQDSAQALYIALERLRQQLGAATPSLAGPLSTSQSPPAQPPTAQPLTSHPTTAQSSTSRREPPQPLSQLAAGIATLVAPAAQVRPDWEVNAAAVLQAAAGVAGSAGSAAPSGLAGSAASAGRAASTPVRDGGPSPFRRGELVDALLSRRTILPRRAQEDLARLLLRQGAELWVLRTTQLPAPPSGVVPLPPGLLEP